MIKFCYTKDLFNPHILRYASMDEAVSFKGKSWNSGVDTIKVSWMGGTKAQQNFVRKYADELFSIINLDVEWGVDRRFSDVRISFQPQGSYSFVGTDCKFSPQHEETMNFGWIDSKRPSKEHRSVCYHEWLHALNLGHEHASPNSPLVWDEDAVIKDLSGRLGWDIKKIYHNVIDKISHERSIATDFDPDSVMLYTFPQNWVVKGKEYINKKNLDPSTTDIEQIKKLYPK